MTLQPIFPLNSALSVLVHGEYPFIPSSCDPKTEVISKISSSEGKKLINRILKTRVVTEDIPPYVSKIYVKEHEIICEEKDLFTIHFTNIVS